MNLIYGIKDRPKFGQLIIFAFQQLLAILNLSYLYANCLLNILLITYIMYTYIIIYLIITYLSSQMMVSS